MDFNFTEETLPSTTTTAPPEVKEECPYCRELFRSVSHHLPYCKNAPKEEETTRISKEEILREIKQYEGIDPDFTSLRKNYTKEGHNGVFYRRAVLNTINFILEVVLDDR